MNYLVVAEIEPMTSYLRDKIQSSQNALKAILEAN